MLASFFVSGGVVNTTQCLICTLSRTPEDEGRDRSVMSVSLRRRHGCASCRRLLANVWTGLVSIGGEFPSTTYSRCSSAGEKLCKVVTAHPLPGQRLRGLSVLG